MKFPIVSLVVALLYVAPAFAQPAPDTTASYRPALDDLMALIGSNKIGDAINRIDQLGDRRENLYDEGLRGVLNSLHADFGDYHSFGIAGTKQMTPQVVEVYAVAYFDNAPVLLTWDFYKPADHYRVQHVRVTTDLSTLLEQVPFLPGK